MLHGSIMLSVGQAKDTFAATLCAKSEAEGGGDGCCSPWMWQGLCGEGHPPGAVVFNQVLPNRSVGDVQLEDLHKEDQDVRTEQGAAEAGEALLRLTPNTGLAALAAGRCSLSRTSFRRRW